MPKEQWLNCKLSDGMFRDEFLAELRLANGRSVTVTVPRAAAEVTGNESGRLRVRSWTSGPVWWATIPTDQPCAVPVLQTDLTAA